MLKGARMARAALMVSTVALVASSVTGVVAFLTWWDLAVDSMAMVNDCCSPGPTVPRSLTWAVRSMEILSSIAVTLAIAADFQCSLDHSPPGCRKRVTLALLLGLPALAIAIAAHVGLR